MSESNTSVMIPATQTSKPATATLSWSRDTWSALRVTTTAGAVRTKLHRAHVAIVEVLRELEAGDVDEHRAPAWETGCAFDKKGRGEAVNVDVYGLDMVHGQPLAVVQVRQYRKTSKNYPGSVRKNYFLVGRNEGTGRAFAHPIESRVVHAAVKRDPSPESSVTAARAWIFEVTPEKLATVLRHGDVAAVPVRTLPAGERTTISEFPAGVKMIDNHVLQADEMVRINGRLYARNPLLQHLLAQHADVQATGWHRIQIGLRASFWAFATPTAD